MIFSSKKERNALILILLAAILLRVCVSQLAPVWAGGEEPAHYTYIQVISETGQIPYHPDENLEIHLLNITGQNPPLYHIIGSLFYAVSNNVYWMRLQSIIFGLLCVIVTFFAAKELTKNRFIILGSVAFVAVLPTFVVNSSTINNEMMMYSLFLISVLFMLKSVNSNFSKINVSLALLFAGLAFITKFNAAMLGLPLLLVLFYFFRKNFSLKKLLVFVPPLLLCIPVLAGNYIAYGKLYPERFVKPAALNSEIITYFIPHVFAGFWLQEYGIAFIPEYRVAIFALLGVIALAAVFGLVKGAKRFSQWQGKKKLLAGIVGLTIASSIGLFIVQNTVLWEPSARYLGSITPLIAIAFMYGLSKFEHKKRIALTAALFGLMLFLDLLLIVNHNTVLPPVPWPLP